MTYRINHPETEVVQGDLRETAVRQRVMIASKGVDLVLGGIPCEWISVYRHLNKVQAQELAEQRATLDYCLELVKHLEPRFWCLEDVVGLAKHLPIMTPHTVINSRYFSAQRRKRLYVGDFPAPIAERRNDETLRNCLRPGPYRIGRRTWDRVPATSRMFVKSQVLAAYPDKKSPTILSQCSRRDAEMAVIDPSLAGQGMRQLEWQEMAAAQGFPQDYVFWGSPTDVAIMIGRAVQIDTGRAILKSIVAKWEKEQEQAGTKPARRRQKAVTV